ncbi:MAG: hypothetical protein A2Y10_03610 [Planctomycetes bacterium GWF2_41_51]|nr:MAG: hypothetical protein A2Y10_03610 [Planctomycetes bacterium GWF2_41_51]HBG28830.1 hypothetical protein [Phycisphaerales bacterium]
MKRMIKLYSIILFVALVSLCGTSSATEPLAEFLFEDNVVNYGLSGGVAEIYNVSGMQPAYSSGGIGNSKCLDNTSASSMGGTGGMVRLSNSSKLSSDMTNLRSFTIMGWMKSASAPNNYAGLSAYASADSGFYLRCYPADRLRLTVDSPDISAEHFYSSTNANYDASDWKFFAVSYDGTKSTDNIKFYYGVNDGTTEIFLDSSHSCAAGTIFMDSAYFYIGNVNTAGADAFDGYLDTNRFFGSKFGSSGALTSEEIAIWKNSNSLDKKRLCVLDTKFQGNVISEGRNIDIGFLRDYNGSLQGFPDLGVDGGKCLDMTMATAMGSGGRGPYFSFGETCGIVNELYMAKSFTVMGWIKSPLTPSNNARIFSYIDGSVRGFELYFNQANRLTLMIGPYNYTSSASANYSCSQWKFFAVTFDGTASSNRIKFYYGTNDGSDAVYLDSATTTAMAQVLGDLGTITIGNRGTIYPFDGFLDSFKVFACKDDGAGSLTQSEIQNFKNDHETAINNISADNNFKKSDVAIMRTSSAIPTAGYAANRIVWNYDTHEGVIGAFETLGVIASQTHNFEATAYYGDTDYTNGKYYTNDSSMPSRTRDIEGNLVEKQDTFGHIYPSVSSQAFEDDTLGRLNDFLLPLKPFTVQYDTPLGDRHAAYLGYPVGFDSSTIEGFRQYLDNKYTNEQLLSLYNISDISAFNYKNWLQVNYGITSNSAYDSMYDTISLTKEFEFYLEDNIAEFFTNLRNTCASAARPAKISGNLAGLRWYNRVLMPVLDFYNLELPRAKVLGTLDEQDAVCSKVAESYGKPLYGVNNFNVTLFTKNNNKPNYMKCLIAAMYANGQVMQTPWNIWSGGEDRYYGSADIYGAFFHFVRDNAVCFDNYEPKSQVGLVWNCDNEITELNAKAAELFSLNIPFDVIMLGDRYPYSRFDVNEVVAKYDQFVLASNYNSWPAANRNIIDELSTKAAVVNSAAALSLTDDWVGTLGTGYPAVWVLPRINNSQASSDRIIHIVNRSYSSSTDAVNTTGFEIELHKKIFDNMKVFSVSWLGPETPETILPFVDNAQSIKVVLPKTPVWSILKVNVKPVGDLNFDDTVDFSDIRVFADEWLQCNNPLDQACSASNLTADLNGDGYINFQDFAEIAENWVK